MDYTVFIFFIIGLLLIEAFLRIFRGFFFYIVQKDNNPSEAKKNWKHAKVLISLSLLFMITLFMYFYCSK